MHLFSSESVSEGHPDKVCDQISDAILDAALSQDPESRVAAETFATTDLVVVGGEISTKATLDIEAIVRQTLRDIGYVDKAYGIDADTCRVLTVIDQQSPDIAQGVNKGEGVDKEMGAGDQGMMFGYACKQSPELMPLTLMFSHNLVKKLAELRKSGTLTYLRPDAKAQVTLSYSDTHTVERVHTIVISTQHDPEVARETIIEDMKTHVIASVIPQHLLDDKTRILVNPTGKFVIGGPQGDAGLTGRKIIIDTYGGWGAHGGGAFSGKDATKVDRSGAYMARYIAKNLVAAGLAEAVEVQLAYAIGIAEPVSVWVNSNGKSPVSNAQLETIVRHHFELTPEGIIRSLDLRRPQFRKTAAYGHFGREDLDVTWEKTDKVAALKDALATHMVG